MNNFFSVKNKKVIFYGAASIGLLTFEKYRDTDLEIVGYIDKRYAEINSFQGLQVWGMDDPVLEGMKNDEYFIFVSVKNVFEHTNIANSLIKKGFENIIYRPRSSLNGIGSEDQNKINDAYSLFETGNMNEIDYVPKSFEPDMFVPANNSVISENDESLVAYISVDQLYTDKKIKRTPWFDKPIFCMLPHINLFRYIAGENGYSIDIYMEFCEINANLMSDIKVTEAWGANVLKNRSSIYEQMSHSSEVEPDFFIRNAPRVSWNKENGIFNLNSGKHRAAFFAAKRRKYIPLRISKNDYNVFLNREKVSDLYDCLKEKEILELIAPIPHPYFYDYPCETKEFFYGFLEWFLYYVSDKLYKKSGWLAFEKICVGTILKDYDFIERTLKKMGMSVIKYNNYEKEIALRVNRLLHFNNRYDAVNDCQRVDYYLFDIRDSWDDRFVFDDRESATEVILITYKNKLRDIDERDICFSSIANGKDVVCIKHSVKSVHEIKGYIKYGLGLETVN